VLGGGNDWKHDPAPALWLASYAQLRRRKALLAEVEFSHAVLDEAQFVKNPDSRAAQTVLAIRARHRLALTGTPLENHPRDVWSIFEFLMPGLLGKRTQFDARLETDPDAVARVARQIAPFVLRRAKQTVAPELPPKVSVPLLCPMSESQREIYRRLAEEGLKALDEEAPAAQGMGLLALLTRLRQAACDPGLLPGRENAPPSASGKIAVLMERLEEILANGRKAVVFSQFVKLLDRVESVLVKNFAQVPRFRLTGATSDRAAPVSAFQKLSGAGVMLASLRAGGTGVTLHSAEYVFLLDPWWNPAVEAQAADRVHRIGQRNTTFVYRLIAEDTVESRVEAMKEAKAELFKQIVGGIGDMSDWREHFPSLRMLLA
jgi:SNF2 family DNA or RNA helicase